MYFNTDTDNKPLRHCIRTYVPGWRMNIPSDDVPPVLFMHWYTPFWNSLTLVTNSRVVFVEFIWCTAKLVFVDTHIGKACWLWHIKAEVLRLNSLGRSEFRGRNTESKEKAMPPTGTVGPEGNHTPWEAHAVTIPNTRRSIHAVMWRNSMHLLASSNNLSKCKTSMTCGCLLAAGGSLYSKHSAEFCSL